MLTSALAILFAKKHKIVSVDCDTDAPNLAIWLSEVKKWDRILPVVASAEPEINLNKCDSCGLCVKNCRFKAIKMVNSKPEIKSIFM